MVVASAAGQHASIATTLSLSRIAKEEAGKQEAKCEDEQEEAGGRFKRKGWRRNMKTRQTEKKKGLSLRL